MLCRLENNALTGVAVVSLDDVANQNALSERLVRDLELLLQTCEAESATKVIVLRANGSMFSVGGNIKQFAQAYDEGTLHSMISSNIGHFNSVVSRLLSLRKVTVAALHGAVAGAGLSLAAACDIRLCAPDTRFVGGFLGVGLPPDTSAGWLLTRLVGVDRAKEFFLTNRVLRADEALSWGLVHAIETDVWQAAGSLAEQLARGPVRAYARSKELMSLATTASLEQFREHETKLVLESVDDQEFIDRILSFRDSLG
jgi:2-(1,2-epoxy-1,2-dihydrophenyl)acetyl-CoA isomerase